MSEKLSNRMLGMMLGAWIFLLIGLAIGYALGYRMGYNIAIRDSGAKPAAAKSAEEMNSSLDLMPTPPGRPASPPDESVPKPKPPAPTN